MEAKAIKNYERYYALQPGFATVETLELTYFGVLGWSKLTEFDLAQYQANARFIKKDGDSCKLLSTDII